jgi:WD40 repeat protein
MYLVGTSRQSIDIWDCQSKERITSLRLPYYNNPVLYSFSSDGLLLAIASSNRLGVTIWDISNVVDRRELCQLKISCAVFDQISSIGFMKNCERLIVGYQSKVGLYDARCGLLLQWTSVIYHGVKFCRGTDDMIVTLSGNGVLQLWDSNLTETRQQRLEISVIGACISPAGDLAAVASTASLIVVNLVTLELREMFAGVSLSSASFQFNMDGTRVLGNALDTSRVLVLDVVNEIVLFGFDSCGGVCFSSDARSIYFGSVTDDKFYLAAVDSETGESVPCPFSVCTTDNSDCYDTLAAVSPVELILM